MSVKYSYIDCQGSRILLREFKGEVSIDEVIDSLKEIIEKEMLFGNTLGVLTDLRGVRIEINVKVFKKITGFLKENPVMYKYKFAAVTDSPKHVVLVTIAGKISSNLKIKPFSTFEASVKWMTEDIID
ncbi:hypothetical protein [Ancylomarina sp. 16SWW S1-10-2]|uniref:hypothetical protein n=1 Tax=Ancylomarina sp. 16SWW S1-10-2 TaxID=2499681 RepID=UPI0012ADE9BB|nr:hypothetical protein [Ancylomarina sp. 16SWW S1-10-2]MRT93610.1 hypothetical protein [Ancylomarina sp. 16SWW S1-10-2]